jgi:carbonic anhydrase
MDRLIRGFFNYHKKKLPQLAPLFKKLAGGQNPCALFFACCDSRFDPNLVVSASPGELFVHRSVGNLIPPAGNKGISVGDVSEASSIEYAVDILGIRDVVIFGHSSCGAMLALLQGLKDPEMTPNLVAWLRLAEPALKRMKELNFDPDLSEADRLSQTNVIVQMENAMTYPAIKKRLKPEALSVHGAWFEVATGQVRYYLPDEKRFVVVDEKKATDFLNRLSRQNPAPT